MKTIVFVKSSAHIGGRKMDVKELKERVEYLEKENKFLKEQNIKFASKYPVMVNTCKERRSTTVHFVDGSYVIVKRAKGEKDSTHTAVAYAITKNLIGSEMLNCLVKCAVDRKTKKNRP